jgi:hypothetical protein
MRGGDYHPTLATGSIHEASHALLDGTHAPDANRPAAARSSDSSLHAALENAFSSRHLASDLGSWHDAPAGAEPVGRSLRAHWTRVGPQGVFYGRVASGESPLAGASVFVLQRSRVVAHATTDDAGRYTIDFIDPGTYSIIVYHSQAILAFGFNAIAHDRGIDAGSTLDSAPLWKSGTAVNRFIQQWIPEIQFTSISGWSIAPDIADDPGWFDVGQIRSLRPDALPATSIRHHRIVLDSGGTASGRLHRIDSRSGRPLPLRRTFVFLLRAGRDMPVACRTQANEHGVFEISGCTPGWYGLLAVGEDGIAAIGVELVDGSLAAKKNAGGQPEIARTKAHPISLARPSDRGLPLDGGSDIGNSKFEIRDVPLYKKVSWGGTSAFPAETREAVAIDVALIDPESAGWLNDFLRDQSFSEDWTGPASNATPGFHGGAPEGTSPGFGAAPPFGPSIPPEFLLPALAPIFDEGGGSRPLPKSPIGP